MALLFSSGQIGRLTVRNRLVMAPMVLNFPTARGEVTDQYLRFYEERARGGVGLIILGAMYAAAAGRGFPHQLGIHTDALIPGLLRLTDAIHRQGAAAFAQLSLRFRERGPADFIPAEIGGLIRAFVEAASRAARAGFDGVELHACHDYLLHHFLSPVTNRRGDAFGGDLTGRARLLLQVVREIKAAIGSTFPLSCRLSADEFQPGGIGLLESQEVARRLRAAGADVIHVSAGVGKSTQHMIPPMEMPSGALLPLAGGIRRAAGPPVIGVGKIDSLDLAEAALSQSQVDFVAVGRGLLADPDLPRKYRDRAVVAVRPCIGCNICVERIRNSLSVACSVNPELGREGQLQLVDRPKEVAVVGAGPAGVQATLTLIRRGHRVTLWDREPFIGGKLLVAAIPPHKQVLATLARHLAHAVLGGRVELRMGMTFGPGQPPESHFQAVVVATGARPSVPAIPGLDSHMVIAAEDLLPIGAGDARRFLVVGGGLVGLETAEFLMAHGRDVLVLEQLETVGQGFVPLRRNLILDRLRNGGVTIQVGTRLARLEGRRPVVAEGGTERALDAFDAVVLATGSVPDRTLLDWARGRFGRVLVVGDAQEPRGVMEAIAQGYEAGSGV